MYYVIKARRTGSGASPRMRVNRVLPVVIE